MRLLWACLPIPSLKYTAICGRGTPGRLSATLLDLPYIHFASDAVGVDHFTLSRGAQVQLWGLQA